MHNNWFKVPIRHSTILIFWLVILSIFLGIYFFAPSIYNRMRQATWQNTPFVNPPINP